MLARTLPAQLVEVHASFERAVARGAGQTIDCPVSAGGQRVLLRFASEAMAARLLPALRHVAVEAGGRVPDLTVHIWDSASTGAAGPPLPPGPPAETPGAWRLRDTADAVEAVRPVVGEYTALARSLDMAWFWMPDADAVPLYEQAAPLRLVWHWWMPGRGQYLVHAGAAGRSGGGLLFVGKGGSGKSTTALACLEAGLRFASDDYVLVGVDPPFVHSLFATAKLEPGHAKCFPRVRSTGGRRTTGDPMDTDKSVFFLDGQFGEDVSRGFPLRAVVVPRVDRDATETRFAPTSARQALLALAPSTLLQLPGGASSLPALTKLVQRVPCYEMHLGSDIAGIPRAVERLLDALEADQP